LVRYSIVPRLSSIGLQARRAAWSTIGPQSRSWSPKLVVSRVELYQRAAGGLRRLLESLGLKRRAKDITQRVPTPEEYSRQLAWEAAKAKAAAEAVAVEVEEAAP
jgi:hypothetical protein